MATGAGYGQTQEGLGGRVNLLVHQVCLELHSVLFIHVLGTDGEKARCDQMLGPVFVGLGRYQIARDLLFYKFVVRFVVVERIDNIIAIPSCLWKRRIDFATR